MSELVASLLSGFMIGLGFIAAIGPQAVFVIRTGLSGRHVGLVCAICIVSDAILIAAGVGFSSVLTRSFGLDDGMLRIGGALFLACCGGWSLAAFAAAPRAAGRGCDRAADAGLCAGTVAAACLALTWLNPHVYLDTLVLLGGLAVVQAVPAAFGVGAVLASVAFFLALGFGARMVRPLLDGIAAQRRIDALSGLVMLSMSAWLALPHLA